MVKIKRTKKRFSPIKNFHLGITSPPYRRTLCEWFTLLVSHLPQCCRRKLQRPSKTIETRTTRIQTHTPQNIRISLKNDQQILATTFDDIHTPKDGRKNNLPKESFSLLPR